MDIVLLVKAAIMGVVEGLTEFLPISSTGHLILAGSLLGFDDAKAKVFDIAIQTGAIFAVILVYWQKIRATLVALPTERQAQRFALNVLIGFVPAVVLGLLFGKAIKAHLFTPVVVATTFIVGGFIILWAERRAPVATRIQSVDDMTPLDMLLFMRVLGLRTKELHTKVQHANQQLDAMHSLAHTDPLTGLPNRRGMQIELSSALARATHENLLAVYVMDLDGFKPVNDQHGHDVGDELLVAVARRLQCHLRQSDVIARLGGDEFVVMTGELQSPAQAHELGLKLLSAFALPFALGGIQVQVGLTIGYALAPIDSQDGAGLLKLADAAMYSGKQSGKFCVRRNTGDLALSSA